MKCNLCSPYILECVPFHLNMVDLPRAVLLEKTDSPFSSSYQLPIASQPEVGLHTQHPSPHWALVWLEFAQVCVCCLNCCTFTRSAILLCPEGTVSPITFGSYTLFSPSSAMIPKPWEEGV